VDEASVDGNEGNDHGQGDHTTHNEGPVPDPATYANFADVKANGGWWGDIIPPFYEDGVTPTGYTPLNWDAAGQSVFNNGCKPAGEPPVVAGSTDATGGDCDVPFVTLSAINTGDTTLVYDVLKNDSEAVTGNVDLDAGTSTGDLKFDGTTGESVSFTIELWDGESMLDSSTATVDLTNCTPPPPPGEVKAALVQGTCDAAAFVTLFNATAEDATFSVTDAAGSTDYTLAAGTQQDVEVVFGEVEVTSGEATLLSDTANPVVGCNTGPNPPPPAPPGLPETL
jgi:hypothetical protein